MLFLLMIVILQSLLCDYIPTTFMLTKNICSLSGTVTASLPVSVGPSQSIPDVPLPQPSVIPQTRSVPQLRTSARVLNKQRREETKVDNVQTNVVGTRKSDVTGNHIKLFNSHYHFFPPLI